MPGQRHLDREHDADLDSDNGQEMITVILIRKRVAHPAFRLEARLRHENRAPDAGGYGFALLQHVGAAAAVQGLTIVHFSAQPEPFLIQNTP